MPATIYTMGSDGKFHAHGLADIIPSGGTVEPPPPVGNDLLWYGTTVFGQSYKRYKVQTLGSAGPDNYDAVESDTLHLGNHGGGVTRVYGDPDASISWNVCKPNYIRNGQPIIYSFKASKTMGETQFKNEMRTFLNNMDGTRIWLTYYHEWDKETGWTYNGASINQWYEKHLWMREVLEEASYSAYAERNGGPVKIGPIATGTPFNKGTGAASGRQWNQYHDGMTAFAGRPAEEIWDFWGTDRYNPAWDGANRYMAFADWVVRMDAMHAATGLPMVIGEGGTARASTFPGGWTVEQRDTERAQWIKDQYDAILARGYFDAYAWWRVPATSDSTNAFSTVMITPTGYNAELVTVNKVMTNGGPDAQAVVNIHSQYCAQSMQAAQPQIPFYVP